MSKDKARDYYGQSLIELGLSEDLLSSILATTTLAGITGKVAFVDTFVGSFAIKEGHSLGSYDALREYAAISLVRKLDYRISPRSFHVNPSRGLLVTERIFGAQPLIITEEIVEQMAKHLTKIHSKLFPKSGILHLQKDEIYTPLERVKQQVDFLNEWFPKMNRYMEARNKSLAGEMARGVKQITSDAIRNEEIFRTRGFTLVHYDLNPDNFRIVPDRGLVLLDWGQHFIADPSMDVAKFFYKCNLTFDQREQFLNHYKSYVDKSEFRQRILTYGNLILVGSYCWKMRLFNEDMKKLSLAKYLNRAKLEEELVRDIDSIVNQGKHE